MSTRTRTAMESFWEYVSFVMNSLVFLLIGLEIHVRQLLRNWPLVALAVGAVLVGRVLSVYLFVPLSNRFTEKIPFRWQHVVIWGGLRGALALALALSLPSTFPYRDQILDLTFGVVIFSIVEKCVFPYNFTRRINLYPLCIVCRWRHPSSNLLQPVARVLGARRSHSLHIPPRCM